MFDYAMFEASRSRYEDILREMAEDRKGVEVHGVSPRHAIEHNVTEHHLLPHWVEQLLSGSPFRQRQSENTDHRAN